MNGLDDVIPAAVCAVALGPPMRAIARRVHDATIAPYAPPSPAMALTVVLASGTPGVEIPVMADWLTGHDPEVIGAVYVYDARERGRALG